MTSGSGGSAESQAVAYHWDGLAWEARPLDWSGRVLGLTGTQSDKIWASVMEGTDPFEATFHVAIWNGTQWTTQENAPTVPLNHLVALGPDDIWATSAWIDYHWRWPHLDLPPDRPSPASSTSPSVGNELWAVWNNSIVRKSLGM